jgi:hypothetical protein
MMKNHDAALKLVVTLALAVFLTGCSNMLFDKPEKQGGGISAGKGAVRWSVETQTGRTALPAIAFDKYELSFTGVGKSPVTETFTENSGELMLESGRWELTVSAYIGLDLAARGTTPVVVRGGQTNSVRVLLNVLGVTGTGSGTLGYDVTLPAELLYADLLVMSSDGAFSTQTSLMTAASGSFTLADGYYVLSLSLRSARRRADLAEVVHVYNGRTTNWACDFSLATLFADAPELSVPAGGTVIHIKSAADMAALVGDIGNPAKNYGQNAYILEEDIDLSAYNPWTPLGTGAAPFKGNLFGDGHIIRGLKLPDGNAESIGLFGTVSEARIENLRVEMADTELTLTGTGTQHLGIIAGHATDTGLKGLLVRMVPGGEFGVTKAGGVLYAGGLTGFLDGSTSLERCGFVGNITALSGGSTSHTGGLAGSGGSAEISESYTVGLVTHTNSASGASVYTAGLANGGTIEDCYHNGTIRASGANLQTLGLGGTSISRSYTAGSIINNGAGSASGLSNGAAVSDSAALNLAVSGVAAGRVSGDSGGVFTNNYARTTMLINGYFIADAASNPQNHQNGLGKTTAELQSQSVYETGMGWDFDNVWEMGPSSYPYPLLKWQQGAVDLPDAYGRVELPEGFVANFANLNDFGNYLAALPQNSALDPYSIKLSSLSMDDFSCLLVKSNGVPRVNDPLWNIYASLAGKYVRLDLSACTGSYINNPYFYTASTEEFMTLRPNKEMLVSILLPPSLTAIGAYAFASCSSLTSLTCMAVNPPYWGMANVLSGTPSSLVIYVPAASVEAYKADEDWSMYANKITAIP